MLVRTWPRSNSPRPANAHPGQLLAASTSRRLACSEADDRLSYWYAVRVYLLVARESACLAPLIKYSKMQNDSEWYGIGFVITAIITFIGSWIYCIATYGFLLGVGLGWLPSIFVAVIAGVLWPLIALAIAAIAVLIFKN